MSRPTASSTRARYAVLAALVVLGGLPCADGSTTLSATLTSTSSPIIVTETALLNDTAGILTLPTANLFTTNLASVTSSAGSGFFGTPVSVLVDGQFGPASNTGGAATFFPASTQTITFNLNLATAPGGFTIGELDSYSGWDAGRGGQGYSVAFSTAASPTVFIPLFTVTDWNANANVGIQPESIISANGGDQVIAGETSLTSQTGVLATNVAAIQYTFDAYDNNGTGYREFDAFGASVPEPSTYATLVGTAALGLALFLRLRRGVR